jgi:hypothetical protein
MLDVLDKLMYFGICGIKSVVTSVTLCDAVMEQAHVILLDMLSTGNHKVV